MSDDDRRLVMLLQASLASMEMRHERGFSLEVPLDWVRAAHDVLYGDQAEVVMERRVDAARQRLANQHRSE